MGISGVDAISGVRGVYRVYFHLNYPRNILNHSLPIRQINFPHLATSPNLGEQTPRSWQIGSFYSLFNFLINNQGIDKSKGIEDKSKEECKLCQGRQYICSNGETSDGKAPIIPGRQSELRIQHHEAQHLHQARIKATSEGKVVISQYISLQHAICPECGGSYVSHGQAVTQTLGKQEFQQLIQQPRFSKPTYQPSALINDQKPEGKGINIDFYG